MNKQEFIKKYDLTFTVISDLDTLIQSKAIEFAEFLGKKELTYAIETQEWHDGFVGLTSQEWYEQFKETK